MEKLAYIGKHCSVDYCNMRDFLPFTCRKCRKVVCLEHRSLKAHNCEKMNSGNMRAVECPKCFKVLKSD